MAYCQTILQNIMIIRPMGNWCCNQMLLRPLRAMLRVLMLLITSKSYWVKGKKLGLQYTYLDNSEITIYSNYSSSDMTINTNLFMGSACIYNPKKDRYVKFLTAGSETTLDSLDQYADSEGNVKIRYDVKADSGLDGMYNNIALPKLHIIGR